MKKGTEIKLSTKIPKIKNWTKLLKLSFKMKLKIKNKS